MRYDPKQAVACLPEDSYQATLKTAEETISKSNKDMLVISFDVYAPQGVFHLKEYIVKESLWKLKRIAQAVGAEASFAKGEFFAADYVGRNLTLDLIVEESPDFGDQNRIKAYRKSTGSTPVPSGNGAEENIPF